MRNKRKGNISQEDQQIEFMRKDSYMTQDTESNIRETSFSINQNTTNSIIHHHSDEIRQLKQLIIRNTNFSNNINHYIPTLRSLTFIIFFIAVTYLILSSVQNRYDSEIEELKLKQIEMKREINYLTRVIQNIEFKLQQFQKQSDKLSNQILDIHMNQLIKEDSSMNILKKYSNSLNFSVDSRNNNEEKFTKHFKFFHSNVTSIVRISSTNDEQFFYSKDPFPQNTVSYLQIKIETTLSNKIAMGIMPHEKREQNCIYCDSTRIYYLYAQNGYIYNGEICGLMNKAKETKVTLIKEGDIISMFVNLKDFTVAWYVNGRYVGKQTIMNELQTVNLYPFVQMTNYGDHVTILQ